MTDTVQTRLNADARPRNAPAAAAASNWLGRSMIGLILLLTGPSCIAAQVTAKPAASKQPDIRIDDVSRFYKVYDAAHGHPDAQTLQHDYLDPGSAGLHEFVSARIHSAEKLASAIEKSPDVYRQTRDCAKALPAVRTSLQPVFSKLAQLYPEARFPPVTVVIGRNTTGGTTTPAGVTIGLETVCRARWMNPDISARLMHLIAHEYVHVQQPAAAVAPPPGATLLFQSLVEGGAEFIGEMISGEIANTQLLRWTKGQECTIESAFQKQAMGTGVSDWLYNGPGDADKPGDLGYWVGYRMARAYYARATDKRKAIADIIAISNESAPAFLRRSGWSAQADCRAALDSSR